MPEPFKVEYPRIIAVRAPVIPEDATGEERAVIEDADAVIAASIYFSGHGRCDGWGDGDATEGIPCRCGTLVRPLPVLAGTGATA